MGEETDLHREQEIAVALFNKGIAAQDLGDVSSELAAYDELVRRFADRDELPLALLVAQGLYNKAVVLGRAGQHASAASACDHIITRFGQRSEDALVEEVAKAMASKAVSALHQHRIEEGLSAIVEYEKRFGAKRGRVFDKCADALRTLVRDLASGLEGGSA